MASSPYLAVLALIFGVPFCSAATNSAYSANYASSSSPDSRGSVAVGSSSTSSGGYKVTVTQLNVNGKCISTLNIVGHGIRKLVDYPCGIVPYPIINVNQTLVIGSEWYTESPGVLIHITDTSCTYEYFQDASGRRTNQVANLPKEDCEKVKQRIIALREHYEKWAEYYKNKQKEAQQHLQALQSNLFSALGGLFSNFPLG